jgi:hypothetical protein
MSPELPALYFGYVALSDVKATGNVNLPIPARPYLANILFRQLCTPNALPARISTPSEHVAPVVFGRAQFKMLHIDASPVVALVTHDEPGWDRPELLLV